MGDKGKGSVEPELVWRVTPENPLGELLELVPMEAPSRGRKSSRKVVWTRVPPVLPEGPAGAQRVEPAAQPAPRAASSTAASAEYATSWRASSWDLLNGLVVRDVSDKIPARTFDALFSANEDAARPPGRKQR
ncbi:MAG TPA: hypothetical protein VHM00_17595 [Caldimonas sp.]|nr:hypothetical protein [Caldimonas sp.]HEX2542882.1 hypothetical protein [Caldimonas sp.]